MEHLRPGSLDTFTVYYNKKKSNVPNRDWSQRVCWQSNGDGCQGKNSSSWSLHENNGARSNYSGSFLKSKGVLEAVFTGVWFHKVIAWC